MKFHALFCTILFGVCLVACSDDSSPTGNSSTDSNGGATLSPSGRIESALIGIWVENPVKYFTADTLIFSDTKYRTPYLSGTGYLFTAKSGIVTGGPDNKVVGEYLRSDDTLWFDGLLGESPNGVDKATARRYVKKPS